MGVVIRIADKRRPAATLLAYPLLPVASCNTRLPTVSGCGLRTTEEGVGTGTKLWSTEYTPQGKEMDSVWWMRRRRLEAHKKAQLAIEVRIVYEISPAAVAKESVIHDAAGHQPGPPPGSHLSAQYS